MMSQLKAAGRKEFPLLIKGDVQGSVEAIVGALEKVGNDEVAARIIHAGAGGINESDVTLAEASGAVVIGFNVRANKEAREAAERAGVEIRYYNIIYDLVDDMKQAMSGLLAPTLREERLGEARILQVFAVSKVGKVAGCLVQDGRVERGAQRAPHPRQRRHPRRQALDAQALQGRGQGSRAPARSAAWPSRTTRTCASATSSSATASRRSAARSERVLVFRTERARRPDSGLGLGVLPRFSAVARQPAFAPVRSRAGGDP